MLTSHFDLHPTLDGEFTVPFYDWRLVNKLKLYRFIEDAWEDGLCAWCEHASRAAFDGARCWMIVANRGQVRWMKQKALSAGMSLFGIRFLEAQMLRRELCTVLETGALSLGSETLEFLLKVEAQDRPDLESLSVARNAAPCLAAMDDLSAAGWGGDQRVLRFLPEAVRDFFTTLRDSNAWTPELDRQLMAESKHATSSNLRICLVGWDAERWKDLNLLEAAAQAAAACEVYLPMPRSSGETLHQSWIEAVESRLRIDKDICVASDFVSGNEPLVSQLEGGDPGAGPVSVPRLLVGHDWHDEMRLVCDHVTEWLASSESGQRLAVIVPSRSPSSLEIVRSLTQAGIEILDETGEKPEATLEVLIQQQIVRYHLTGCDVESLLELIKLLNKQVSPKPQPPEPDTAHDLLQRAFAGVQSRNARLLMGAWKPSSSGGTQQISDLVLRLGRWDSDLAWDDARAKWESCLQSFGMTTGILEPLWSRIRKVLGTRTIKARAFLEYLESILSGKQSRRPADANTSCARVVVTTLPNALHQTWDCLVFLDANEGVWPVTPEENPFLDNAARREINNRRTPQHGHLLSSIDRSLLEQARFLDLVEHCAGGIAFAAVATNPDGELHPNEWVVRCFVRTGGMPNLWRESIRRCERLMEPVSPTANEELAHLRIVHASRRDPTIPFDRFLFNFDECSFDTRPWPATKLDSVFNQPATFAMAEILGVEASEQFQRSEGMAIGCSVHEWLAGALRGAEPFQPFAWNQLLLDEIKLQMEQATDRLRKRFGSENLPLPLWWKSALSKAAWAARGCMLVLRDFHYDWFSMEQTLKKEVRTAGGPLKLKGRVDLLLSDRDTLAGAHAHVIDFKTGKTKPPTLGSLEKGEGNQFAAYYLLARESGAAGVTVGLARPNDLKSEVFSDQDESGLREALAPLARLQGTLNFGQRGPLVDDHGPCESLPMATTPIDAAVLETKRNLFLLAQ